MKKFFLTLAFLVFSIVSFSQSYSGVKTSKHEADLKSHPAPRLSSENIIRNEEIVSLNTSALLPTSSVFGYMPYWEYPDALEYLQYDLLSHISAFDFHLYPNGNIDFPSNWPWADLINESHQNGVKVIATVVNFSADEIHTILTDEVVKDNFFTNILNLLMDDNLNGVNIDFEGLYTADRGELLNTFMLDLSNYLHASDMGYEVSFAGPAVNWGGWDFEGLAASCDYIFIMGYNYNGGWSTKSGACAPLTGSSINVTNTVLTQYAEVTESNPEKLILGVPYYGNKWRTSSPSAHSTVIEHLGQPFYSTAMDKAEQDSLLWDAYSQTSWSLYDSERNYEQTWFDTDTSLGLKYDLADENLLKGVGMWALGYDEERTELWDELRRRYAPVSVEEALQNNFAKLSIFPNPFCETTSLIIESETDATVVINIYNIEGKIIPSLTMEKFVASGTARLPIDLNRQKNGLYFCQVQLRTKEKYFVVSKKLVKNF